MYTIKKLEWYTSGKDWQAQGMPLTSYVIWENEEGDFDVLIFQLVVTRDTLEDAKDAAQNHYEKEVKKHLVLKSPDVQGEE